jgi:hypothetical protein
MRRIVLHRPPESGHISLRACAIQQPQEIVVVFKYFSHCATPGWVKWRDVSGRSALRIRVAITSIR